jgi:cytochrome b6-f complex iron-sulfur subunit
VVVDGPVALWRDGGATGACSRRCTHLGCEVRADDGGLACPCHGSRFDLRGRVTRGPARTDLAPLAVRVEPDGRAVVELGG